MKNDLLIPLDTVIRAAEMLLSNTTLNFPQERIVKSIYDVAVNLHDLIISLPELNSDNAKTVLSYETRSNLASVIGYAEELLEGEEGGLDEAQQQHVRQIRASGRQVLNRLTMLLE
jgi:signal transduction histidine kinase